jgi:CubicO group peptidase (beta-lactamase class C family)
MQMKPPRALLALALPAALAGVALGAPAARAQAVGDAMQTAIARADSAVAKAVADNMTGGAVLLVARDGKVIHRKAFGWAQRYDYALRPLPDPVAMHDTTAFDMASVTKPLATTLAVMRLVDQGKVKLDAPLYTYLPRFRGPHLDSITPRLLLQHAAGLNEWQPIYYHASNARDAYHVIRDLPLKYGVGQGRHYSDLGFMLLGYMTTYITGVPIDQYVRAEFYRPLGLRRTMFLPKSNGLRDIAATDQGNPYERHMVYDSAFGDYYAGDPRAWDDWRRYTLVGEVDDGNAWYANEGVAGHAGLFSTADDLNVLLQLLLNRGVYGGKRYLKAATVDTFLTRDRFDNALGWSVPKELPVGSFAHTGFTGTYVLGVPRAGLAVVLLANRENVGTDARGYYPDLQPLRGFVGRVLTEAALSRATPSPAGSGSP